MTDTGSQEKPPVDEPTEAVAAETPAPPPEPWTEKRVFEWNSYYDLYVAAFVVLLAFFSSASKIQTNNSVIFSMLQAGRQTVETGAPVVTDNVSMAGEGTRWVNVPWLYEVTHYGLYAAVSGIVMPSGPTIQPGTSPEAVAALTRAAEEARNIAKPRAEQYGIGALIALDALARGLTALLLLGLRRKGPGLWWSAICVTMALGVTLFPTSLPSIQTTADGESVVNFSPSIGVQIGGIASLPSVVAPDTWGLLFLAIELLLLHQAINLGKPRRLYGLIPLFLVWANMDDSFGFGLLMLAASALGGLIESKRRRGPKAVATSPSPRPGLIVLGLCLAATFVNPSHVHGVMAGLEVFPRSIGLEIGPPTYQPFFLFNPSMGKGVGLSLQLYYGLLVGVGLISFLLNRRGFSLGRFLMFVAASVAWVLAYNYITAVFALVLVATLVLNGQEWYHQTFGTEGKLGSSWTAWSTGGRLVTIAVVFLAIACAVTGWASRVGDPQFGFGFNPDDFPFESAESLRDAPIEGAILNTSLAQGDAIAWKALSNRKAYVDSRQHLYPSSVLEDWRKELRFALRDDDIAKWQPVLDRYKISAVMIQLMGDARDNAPKTYGKLMSSPNWIPFYDDGTVVMFGRADSKAPAADVAYFKANRLDAEELVYKRPKPVPLWERPPTPTWELVDSIFQNRLLNIPQPHTQSSYRWMRPAKQPFPTPAHCLMAIREARAALSIKPDDTFAFEMLKEAYQILLAEETVILQGRPLTTENISRVIQAVAPVRYLSNRSRQLLTVLNFRIATLPPPKGPDDLKMKADLNFALGQLYLQVNANDLARDRFQIVANEARTSQMSSDDLNRLTQILLDLNKQYEQTQSQLNELALNRGISPLDKANFARSRGAPGLAIHELVEANEAGGTIPGIRQLLVDLYCETGQPDKAFDLIYSLEVDDQTLSTGVGTATYRQGMIYFLLGNYVDAITLWGEKSIPQLQRQRSMEAPMATKMFLGGDPIASTKTFLELPDNVSLQARWDFELALAALEGGKPTDMAVKHFETALKLDPSLPVRPLIAYYLEKLGKPIPAEAAKPVEPSTATPAPATPPTNPPGEKSDLPSDVFAPKPAEPVKPPQPTKDRSLPEIIVPPKP